jgi:hypothetical protein
MSINELAADMEETAQAALLKSGALIACSSHGVLVRVGDIDAESHAYALATNQLKQEDTMFLREDLMAAIKNELDMAADDECPACSDLLNA